MSDTNTFVKRMGLFEVIPQVFCSIKRKILFFFKKKHTHTVLKYTEVTSVWGHHDS